MVYSLFTCVIVLHLIGLGLIVLICRRLAERCRKFNKYDPK